MKRIIISLVLFLNAGTCLYADNRDISFRFETANKYYQDGYYEDAIDEYETLILDGFINPYVYYNLSVAYYKNNEIGRAVLNLERALKLMPRNKDFQYNKEVLAELVQEPQKNIAEKFLYDTIKSFSLNEIISITLAVFIILLLLTSLYLFKLKNKLVPFLVLVLILNVFSFSLLYLKFYDEVVLNKYIAIRTIPVRNKPSKDDDISFEINEGRQIIVLSEIGRWVNVKLSDGFTGWVDKNFIEKI